MPRSVSMRTFILAVALLALTLGCSGTSFISRPVRENDPWLVRLQTYAEAGKAREVQHDHPANWTEADLGAVLSRLYLIERVGLLDKPPQPKPVFAPEEVGQLAPAIAEAFRLAQPNEWVTFFVASPRGQDNIVTSGGLYVDGQQLHVIVANYREVAPFGEEAQQLKANPLRTLKVRGSTLTFEPATYVIFSRSNWMSGYDNAAASEVILDHRKFLISLKQTPPAPAKPAQVTQPPQQGAGPAAGDALNATVQQLKNEIDQLKRRLAEQDEELAKLKSKPAETTPSKKSPARKQPAQ